MSGHLLATTNPEAAAEIQPDAPRPRLPGVGQTVVYHMRRGHGRNGRTSFPALVQGHGERDTLMLTVIIDAGDMVDEQFVEQIGLGKDDGHCWEWPEGVRPLAERLDEPAGLRSKVNEIESQISELYTCVLGDFDIPKISLISILQDFENRLRAIKQENNDLRVAAGPAPKTKAKSKKK